METKPDVLTGRPIVQGIAIGKIKVLSSNLDKYFAAYVVGTPETELQRLQVAVQGAKDDLLNIISVANQAKEEEKAKIMEAHMMMIDDPMVGDTIAGKISEGLSAPKAAIATGEELAAMFSAMDDAYLRERAADMKDINNRVARKLLGVPELTFDEPAIICAMDIEPSTMASIPVDKVQGVALVQGSTTSHAVIIAKSRNLVCVVGMQEAVLGLPDGANAVLDGNKGQLVVQPEEQVMALYSRWRDEEMEKQQLAIVSAKEPSVTKDGQYVQLAANIGLPTDMDSALKYGCQGVGLFRTEFLFMGHATPPTEDEQFEAYRTVAEKCGEHLCVIRTMDIGGDKPLPYLQVEHEENPFLGCRAVRLCFENLPIFKTQLKALLRAGAYGKLAIMVPMIISIAEVRQVRALMMECRLELEHEGKVYGKNIQIGIMVETPAAAANAEGLIKECDFFSIGTNDLCQYTLAVDRMNHSIAHLYDHFNPAVLRLIHNTIQAGATARAQGKEHFWVGMCGEMASDPLACAMLVGMGIDELSMNAPARPRVHQMIRSLDTREAKAAIPEILKLEDGNQVREYLKEHFGK